ncbi:hypothetical protein [Rhodoferax sp.]|uniref:hypothetical protein n=1 Tax=Rhodoferax sp. TaxID=50421 RepID=UPI00263724FD|nr:hypothetical protein [Rhodoferax sp.]MDD2926652.1 hypothetical protein [Rhodoferax sp.]
MVIHHPDTPAVTPLNQLHDLARVHAAHLRQQAVDDFWRGANTVWLRSLQSGEAALARSATRLQARLARRARNRAAGTSTSTALPRSGV